MSALRFPSMSMRSLTTTRDDAGAPDGGRIATMPWGWLTLLSLVPAIASTVLLASILVERSNSYVAPPTIAEPVTAEPAPAVEVRAPVAAPAEAKVEPAEIAASPAAPGGAVDATATRPRSYSSIDTETLAAARAYPNAVALKPATSQAQSAAAPEQRNAEAPRAARRIVDTDQRDRVELTRAQQLRERRAVAPAPDVGSAAGSVSRVVVARREPASPPPRTDVPELRTPSIDTPARAANPPADDVDNTWARREQWLRERLQRPETVTR